MKFLVNKSKRLRSPQQKANLNEAFFSQGNYDLVKGTLDDLLDLHCNGFQVIPAEFEQKVHNGRMRIRSMDCWVSQSVFIVEIDSNVTETSLEQVVENDLFIKQNAYALTESIRSRYNDPKDDTCNGEMRYRVWFKTPFTGRIKEEIYWFIDRLLQNFPQADPSGSKPLTGAYGMVGLNYLRLGNDIGMNVIKAWGKEYQEYRKRPKPVSEVDIESLSELDEQYRDELGSLDYDSNGWSTTRLPCMFHSHSNDSWGGQFNAMAVRKLGGVYVFKCHKCGEHKTFGKKRKVSRPVQNRSLPIGRTGINKKMFGAGIHKRAFSQAIGRQA